MTDIPRRNVTARFTRAPQLPELDIEQVFFRRIEAAGIYGDVARVLAIECARALHETPHAELVRAALGDDATTYVGRMAGANGWDQSRLLRAARSLAGWPR